MVKRRQERERDEESARHAADERRARLIADLRARETARRGDAEPPAAEPEAAEPEAVEPESVTEPEDPA